LPATRCCETRALRLKHSVPKAVDTDSAQGVSAMPSATHRRAQQRRKISGFPLRVIPFDISFLAARRGYAKRRSLSGVTLVTAPGPSGAHLDF
jgi:hypothetical protein